MAEITHIFFDVGGVVLTNGWDHMNREEAAQAFGYDFEESDKIHAEVAGDFDAGKLKLDEYLKKVVFYEKREFSKKQFIEFMQSRSQPYQTTFDVLDKLCRKNIYHLSTINDESLELNKYRIKKFKLDKYFRNFFSSCYLGVKKPHKEIFEKVLAITNANPAKCLFIDDREANAEAAASCGFQVLPLKSVFNLEKDLEKLKII